MACSPRKPRRPEAVLNLIGFHIDYDPAPMLFLEPTLDMAKTISKDRIAPMRRDTPALRAKIRDARTRDSDNTLLHKSFPGGHLTLAGANSAADLSSRPIRIVIADEVDRYPPSAGTEGDPVQLATTRTSTFWNALVVLISSPGTAGISRLEVAWNESDQRRYFVPCPDCGEFQTLIWDQVHWDKSESGAHVPESAIYACKRCGSAWDDVDRWGAVSQGEWRATAEFKGTAGFHLSALYSPWERRNLQALVKQWLAAQGNTPLLKVFINTVLAEWWEEKYHSLDKDRIRERSEEYPEQEGQQVVPRTAAVLTAGVDVQDDRIECQVEAWGRGEENWKLEYHVLPGDPSAKAIWDELWELICRPRRLERGGVDYIRATCVDTGHHTLRAYDFCRPRFRVPTPDGRRAYVFAVKGSAGAGDLWPKKPNMNNKGKIPLFTLRVDAAKEAIHRSLQKNVEPGPGYIHFPSWLPAEYYEQLTAEQAHEVHDKRGFPSRAWELKSPGRRNEALDTAVYAMAGLEGLKSMGLDLEAEANRVEALIELATKADAAHSPAKTKRGRRKNSSSWLNR